MHRWCTHALVASKIHIAEFIGLSLDDVERAYSFVATTELRYHAQPQRREVAFWAVLSMADTRLGNAELSGGLYLGEVGLGSCLFREGG